MRQDVSLNPQKLAGQCAKLKCCLNYETAVYTEAIQKLPRRDINLETKDATYYYFKADILAGLVSYSTDKHLAANIVTVTSQRAKEIIQLNQQGEKPDSLSDNATAGQKNGIVDLAEQDSLTRFDKSKRKKKKKRNERKPKDADVITARTNDRETQSENEPRGDRPQPATLSGNTEQQGSDNQKVAEPRTYNRRRNFRHKRHNNNDKTE